MASRVHGNISVQTLRGGRNLSFLVEPLHLSGQCLLFIWEAEKTAEDRLHGERLEPRREQPLKQTGVPHAQRFSPFHRTRY